ncbi:MAG: HEAT repeat domain-containing protein, partial [Verrucomicrobiota bacterium]|nr:HEAT repeat domain-containing protein [Verrucomicrobiota bacterium]
MKLKYTLVGLLCLLFINGCATGRTKLDASTNKLCLEVLREGLRSDEFWPSIHAAEGLTLGGYGREVRAHLEPKLKTEKDDQHRCGLARELVRAGDKDKLKIMIGILEGEKDHGHVHAAESLYKVGGAGKIKPMHAAFAQKKNVRLQLMAAAAMGKAGDDKTMAFLRERMRSEKDPKLYTVVAWILGRIGAESDIDLIRSRLADAPDALSKAYLNHAMAALGDPQG